MLLRRILLALSIVALVSTWVSSQHRRSFKHSAWDVLLQQSPEAVDDSSLSWQDRLILYALSPEQARAYYEHGAKADSLLLDSGETLAEYLEARREPAGNVYVQLATTCRLFSQQTLSEGEIRILQARGEDLFGQGGARQGCTIPQEAVALLVQIRSEAPVGSAVKLWSTDTPEPAAAILESTPEVSETHGSTVLVPLCRRQCSEGDFQMRSSAMARLEADVMGYFRKFTAADHPSGTISFLTETAAETAVGSGALANNTSSGDFNTAVGVNALNANTSGDRNTALGRRALQDNTASSNTAVGESALRDNTTGSLNTAVGQAALLLNTNGNQNTAVGEDALHDNTSGSRNTAVGENAGFSNTTGFDNSFFGKTAGRSNTTGFNNSFFGVEAGEHNTTGSSNSSLGEKAGEDNTTGNHNSFFGKGAGWRNTVENNNTFIGSVADMDPGPDPATSPVENATALGHKALVSQSNSLVLGSIPGLNLGTSYVNVGIGATAPHEALHVHRSDGTANLLVEETSSSTAARFLFSLVNNGGSRFSFENTNDGRQWFFSLDGNSNFNASLAGTGGAEFLIRKNGRVQMGPGAAWVFDLAPNGDLDIAGDLTANGMFYASDRNLKENFNPVDTQEILDQVKQLKITRWNYRKDEKETAHLGPVAQDFYAAFGLGGDETQINAADISGVSLAAIQGLHKEIQEQMQEKDSEIKELRQENRELRQEIREIHRRLDEMAQPLSAGS